MAERTEVRAVASFLGQGAIGSKVELLEQAMAQAVRDALAAGVSLDDTKTLRRVQIDARDRVLKD